MKKSWKTTTMGIISGAMILLAQAETMLDGDPDTNPNVELIISAFGMIGLGLSARDNKLSSEEVGAK